MTKRFLQRFLLFLPLLVCVLLVYVTLVTGIVDDVFITRNREASVNQIELAIESDPPNIEYLIDALNGADWYVSAVAADRLGQLAESSKIDETQINIVIHSLLEALANNGHWWRFGWDREDAEYELFRSAAIEAVSKYGSEALPDVAQATNSDNHYEREAACWIVLTMFKHGWADQTDLANSNIPERIESLAQSDPNENVKSACMSAQKVLEALTTP
jgi:hypothetical protein